MPITIKFYPIKTEKLKFSIIKAKNQNAALKPMMNINNFPIEKDIPHKKRSKENQKQQQPQPAAPKKLNKLKINTTNHKSLKKTI